MKKILLAFISFIAIQASAQYRIEIQMQAAKDSVYYLYHWYQSEKLYLIKDTAQVVEGNKIMFEGSKNLPEGMYFLVSKKGKSYARLFDFPVVGQNFTIKTDTSAYIEKMAITGNKELTDYCLFTQKNLQLQRSFQKSTNENEKKEIYENFRKLSKDYMAEHPKSFTGNFLKANQTIELPQLSAKSSRKDTINHVKYYYALAFDNIDLTDDRLIRTTLLDGIFDDYLKNISYSNSPDEIIQLAEQLINKTLPKSELRKYVVIKFGNKFIAPDVLGCDKVYTEIAKKYIIGQPDDFDANTVKINEKYVGRIEPTLVGKILPDMCLTDTLDKWSSLWDMKSKYTMVVIYDYGCGHCQEFTKKLVDYYPKLEKQGMQVYMCCKIPDRENWLKFIKTYKTEAFTNVMDSKNVVDFDNTYNASMVPKVFLLDNNKKVLSNLRLEMTDYERMMKN